MLLVCVLLAVVEEAVQLGGQESSRMPKLGVFSRKDNLAVCGLCLCCVIGLLVVCRLLVS